MIKFVMLYVALVCCTAPEMAAKLFSAPETRLAEGLHIGALALISKHGTD